MAKIDILKLLKRLAPILPAPIYWEDINSILLGGNDAVFKATGAMHAEAYVGKSLYELYPHDMAEHIKLHNNAVMKTGLTLFQEEAIEDISTGQVKYFTAIKAPLRDNDGKIIGIIGTSIDITEEKKLLIELKQAKELAEAANQAKTEFIANMRHDIRTSLSGIVGFSEILRDQLIEPRFKEYADNLVASGHALHELMDEILDAFKVGSGEIPLLKKKFSFAETLNSLTKLYAAKAAEKKLGLTLTVDAKLPNFVIGDKTRFHRIVLELIGNALNFTTVGQITIHAELAKQEQQSLVIRLTVSDTGMGIAKDKQQDIYVQFKRLTPSYQGIYKGAGLGLYIVKQFIDELGGEIYVHSDTGKGATFTCLIPMQLPLLDDESDVEPVNEALIQIPLVLPLVKINTLTLDISPTSQTTSRILVVEDNFIAQTVVKAMLTSMDCHVDVAICGNDALALCKDHHYDLIFMDIGLGECMDGYEVTQCIRQSNLDSVPHIPIVALTAHGGDESRQRCIEAGMDAVLTKPLTQAHAIDILKTFIPARRELPIVAAISLRRDLPDKDEEMFQLSQFALFSPEDALVNCDTQAFLIDLLKLMLEKVPGDLANMKMAYAAKDYSTVEKLAHKMKGGSVYLGTNRMKYACQYVERYWKTGERQLMDALYQQAVGTIEETLSYVKGWLQNAA